MSKTIPLLDLMFFVSETQANPKHVAALILLEAPAHAGKRYVANLAAAYRKATPTAPFNRVAEFGLTHLPRWVEAGPSDMSYHVRHTVLPRGATRDGLLQHVSRQHMRLLDRSRPVFQAEFIEGLPNRTFALYLKMHHAMVDGASAIERILASLSEKPCARSTAPFFAASVDADHLPARRVRAFPVAAVKNLLLTNAVAGKDLAVGLLRKQLRGNRAARSGSAPFTAPRGPMNEPIGERRSLALLSLPIDEMKAAGRVFGGTLNDVAVTVVDAALTRYLKQKRKLTEEPLVAMCPVSLRDAGDREATTKVSAIFVPLGAPKMSIGQRIEQVIASTGSAKEELRGMSKDAAMMYAIAAFGLSEAVELARADSVVRPLANFVLSNVPGSRTDRYLGRAKVIGMYPVSALGAGIGLNVTLLSYAKSMDFGFVANGTSMPDLETLADFTRAAFRELREAARPRERASSAGKRKAGAASPMSSPITKRVGRAEKPPAAKHPRARAN